MPAHGRADAPDACCRPAADVSARHEKEPPTAGFWRSRGTWRRAAVNTAQCLLGCAIGDVAAMTLVPLWWPAVPFVTLMAIAIAAGLATSIVLETVLLRWRERLSFSRALRTALGMSLLSMVGMEVAMNVTDWLVMGGQRMPITHLAYWMAWIPALAVGFLAPLPYNYAQLRRFGRSCH